MTHLLAPLDPADLPPGVRARHVDNGNGLSVHVLESGFEIPGRPCVLLLHGFPELGYSWRKILPALAEAGYHAIAPDQRGYGRTIGWESDYDGDLAPFRMFNLVRDALGLLWAMGHACAHAVIGHDFGSPVAAWCALLRPDVFQRVVLMSAPFGGAPPVPRGVADPAAQPMATKAAGVHQALAALARPRKHYQWYYSTREANADMQFCPQGVHDFLRAYYHVKSADWAPNHPEPLTGWTADQIARLPTYYVMDLDQNMAQTVAPEMPATAQVAACQWLPDDELRVYSEAYAATGFQGGLQWYRCQTGQRFLPEMQLLAGRTIDIPSMFIAGSSDWGVHQKPGDFERMQGTSCTHMVGCHLLPGAGHWVQQEQPDAVAALLTSFLRDK